MQRTEAWFQGEQIYQMQRIEAWFQGEQIYQMQRTEAWFQGSMSDMISVLHQSVSINAKGGDC
jgi:hypothetical protein